MMRISRPAHLAARHACRPATSASTRAAFATTTQSSAPPTTHHPSSPHSTRSYWLAGSLASAALLALTLKPELNPLLLSASADSASTYLDPTTQTPFPSTLSPPSSSSTLQLIGTGVRTVSFLSVRVYAAGFFLAEGALAKPQLRGFTPERLISPKPEDQGLVGEELMSSLLDDTSAAVLIVPLRNTTLTHLRDAFTRAILARLKLPHVASGLTPAELETASLALSEFKALFPARTLAKGAHLELHYDASAKTVLFQIKDPAKPNEVDTMGTLANPVLSKQLLVSYFNNVGAGSPELVRSVAHGLAGEPRS